MERPTLVVGGRPWSEQVPTIPGDAKEHSHLSVGLVTGLDDELHREPAGWTQPTAGQPLRSASRRGDEWESSDR